MLIAWLSMVLVFSGLWSVLILQGGAGRAAADADQGQGGAHGRQLLMTRVAGQRRPRQLGHLLVHVHHCMWAWRSRLHAQSGVSCLKWAWQNGRLQAADIPVPYWLELAGRHW